MSGRTPDRNRSTPMTGSGGGAGAAPSAADSAGFSTAVFRGAAAATRGRYSPSDSYPLARTGVTDPLRSLSVGKSGRSRRHQCDLMSRANEGMIDQSPCLKSTNAPKGGSSINSLRGCMDSAEAHVAADLRACLRRKLLRPTPPPLRSSAIGSGCTVRYWCNASWGLWWIANAEFITTSVR